MNEEVIEMIAGTTLPIKFIAIKEGTNLPLVDVDIKFVLSIYGDITPILTKLKTDFTIVENTALLKFKVTDTIELNGTYEYQITYTDAMGNTSIEEGVILIRPNKK